MGLFGVLGSKADLEVKLSSGTVQPGGELDVVVDVFPKKSFQIRQAKVELNCLVTYVDWQTKRYVRADRFGYRGSGISILGIRVVSFGRDSRSGRYRPLTHRTTVAEETFMHEGHLSQQTPQSATVRLTVPRDVLPTLTGAPFHGMSPGISWKVRAVLDMPKAADAKKDQDIVVVKPPSLDAPRALPAAAESKSRKCVLVLSASSTDVRSQSTIEGTLQVRALKDVNASSVVVQLVRVEEFGDAKQTVEASKLVLERNSMLSAGQTREWPFRLDVGQVAVPTLQAFKSSVEWRLEGKLDMSRRRDPVVRQEMNVDL